MLRVTAFEYRGGRRLRVEFSDGRAGELEWCDRGTGPMTEPLDEPEYFRKVKLNPEFGVLEWPNGYDVAPEYLYFLAFHDDAALAPVFRRWGYLATADAPRTGTRPDAC